MNMTERPSWTKTVKSPSVATYDQAVREWLGGRVSREHLSNRYSFSDRMLSFAPGVIEAVGMLNPANAALGDIIHRMQPQEEQGVRQTLAVLVNCRILRRFQDPKHGTSYAFTHATWMVLDDEESNSCFGRVKSQDVV